MKILKRLMAFAAALCFTGMAHAVVIDFEGFSDGDIIGTVDNATFSSSGGVEVYAFGGSYASSGVNTIADAGGGFTHDLYVDFAMGVNNLSFFSGGDDTNGLQASINVFVNGVFDSMIGLFGDGNYNTVDFHDLSAFSNVTRIEIFNVIDLAGLVYDDFSYDVASVPEPGSLSLIGLGLILLGYTRRRQQVK